MDTTHGLDLAPLAAVRRAAGATGTADAARVLATAGVPVFPCVQGSTRPLTERGPRAASTDPDRVAWWWSRYPATNLAIPTGSVSGLDVVEVYPERGDRSGFGAIRQAMSAGLVPWPGLMVATPYGGLHLFFPRSPETGQRSWTAPQSGVGFHADGGYVVLPPSLVQRPDGAVARHRLVGAGSIAPTPVNADALRSFLDSFQLQGRSTTRAPAIRSSTAASARPRPVRAPVAAAGSFATGPGGVRSLSRPDPGGQSRRSPEVVTL